MSVHDTIIRVLSDKEYNLSKFFRNLQTMNIITSRKILNNWKYLSRMDAHTLVLVTRVPCNHFWVWGKRALNVCNFCFKEWNNKSMQLFILTSLIPDEMFYPFLFLDFASLPALPLRYCTAILQNLLLFVLLLLLQSYHIFVSGIARM